MSVKDPVKLARKELGKLGAELLVDEYGVTCKLPNGFQSRVTARTPLPLVRRIIDTARSVLRDPNDVLAKHRERHDAPPLALGSFRSSAHFRERFLLMAEQGGITASEVTDACLRPTRTVKAEEDRWIYVGDRISVVVAPADRADEFMLVTVQWTKRDLWAAHPRPEKVGS